MTDRQYPLPTSPVPAWERCEWVLSALGHGTCGCCLKRGHDAGHICPHGVSEGEWWNPYLAAATGGSP